MCTTEMSWGQWAPWEGGVSCTFACLVLLRPQPLAMGTPHTHTVTLGDELNACQHPEGTLPTPPPCAPAACLERGLHT